MNTTADKLNYLTETKNAIKTAITAKGGAVNDAMPFREYANAIMGIPQEGGGGGSGIIDVTELPTENIDENAVYRVAENVQIEKTEAYRVSGGYVTSVGDVVAGWGVPASNIHKYVVDELPTDMKPSDVESFTELNFYFLRTDGKVYMHISGHGVITLAIMLFQDPSYDKGFTENVYAETEDGIYTTLEAYKEVVRWFTRKAGNWEEITAYTIVTNAHGFTNTFVLSGKVTTINAFVSGDIEELDESWFVRPDGSEVLRIREYMFYGTKLKRAVIPRYIISLGREALGYCNELTTVTFKGRPAGGINEYLFVGCHNLTTINVPWSEGEVERAPWGATNATINYNYTGG